MEKQFKWLDKNEYPFQSNYYQVNGHQLHYIDEGQGENLLYVHGTPSWSFDFREVIKLLRNDFRCIAIDHMGFGLSDKPFYYDYTTLNHSHTLEKFILDKDLKDLTLIVHDFGGPIGLNFAINHPERVKRIVVMNSWLWSSLDDPDFIKFSKILKSPILPFLYRKLNFSPRFLLPSTFKTFKPDKKILRHYTKPFAHAKQREATLAFARSLLQDQEWFEELWSKKEAILEKEMLFIWGMKDSMIKPQYLEKFEKGFPNSRTSKFEKSGHFPQEEEPVKVATELLSFLGH